jgi:hypothetical protein
VREPNYVVDDPCLAAFLIWVGEPAPVVVLAAGTPTFLFCDRPQLRKYVASYRRESQAADRLLEQLDALVIQARNESPELRDGGSD